MTWKCQIIFILFYKTVEKEKVVLIENISKKYFIVIITLLSNLNHTKEIHALTVKRFLFQQDTECKIHFHKDNLDSKHIQISGRNKTVTKQKY